jgi:hypothetical protein
MLIRQPITGGLAIITRDTLKEEAKVDLEEMQVLF